MNTWEGPPPKPEGIWNDQRWPQGVEDLQAASHLPLFTACIAATSEHSMGGATPPFPVLEIGIGFHSTPILHGICYDRELVSLESDPYWFEVFTPYMTSQHLFMQDNKVTLDELAQKRWSVVLVDDSPGFPRCDNVKLFLPVTDYVLVHDAQGEDIMEPMRPVIKDVPYQLMHKRYFPWTLALSLTQPIPVVP